ncbi:MAG TPA: hypothetical protein VG408_00320, partial [Actinomycetota bacterium]|nr:hypothetical protein [Actinomycetota bacterium]
KRDNRTGEMSHKGRRNVMGLKDRLTGSETAGAASGGHYEAEVNKGSIHMGMGRRGPDLSQEERKDPRGHTPAHDEQTLEESLKLPGVTKTLRCPSRRSS